MTNSKPNASSSPNYFKEALELLVGKRCPIRVGRYGTDGMPEREIMRLQDWCAINARPKWATGLSMIEGAELIVNGAEENANIPRRGKP